MAFLSCTSDLSFSPLFRLLDDYETHLSTPAPTKSSRCKSTSTPGSTPTRAISRTVFTPAFDVRELNDAYYLDGELPGVDQSNIEIEFTDPQTLVVKGRTERNYASTSSSASPQTETVTETESRGRDTPTTSRTPSPSWHQPTVEDDNEDDARSTTSSASASSARSTSSAAVIVQKPSAPAPAPATSSSSSPSLKDHYWIAERSIGDFQRTFAFTARVDQDGVRAALKNGILSIVVPKEAAPKTKKIRIN